MNIRFVNARLMTMKDGPSIAEGELWVSGNRIEYVGPSKATKKIFDRTIDCHGNVLMPGFKNAHTHSAMTFLRSYADDMNLKDWLYEAVFPLEAKLTKEDVYTLSKLAFAEYVASGITADFDMYYYPEVTAQASIDFGFRTVCLGTVTKMRSSVDEMVESFKKINKKDSLVSYRLGFHAEFTTSEEILIELSKAANKLKTPIFTHTSETYAEVQGCIERHGCTPPVYFEKLGLYNYGGGGFHCVWLSEEDLQIFKKRGLWVVTCPASNAKLASGTAPIQKMIDMGINLAIGTDGPASNNSLDFFKEMYLVTAFQKLFTKDPQAAHPYKILEMATVGGAHAMGLNDADILDVGKLADIVMLDLSKPNMQPLHNIPKNIVYAGMTSDVKMTMINGKVVYEDGKFFIDEPIEDIYRKANAITKRIIK